MEKKAETKFESECYHESCRCKVAEFGEFCSDWCKNAIDTTDCGCGHEECHSIA